MHERRILFLSIVIGILIPTYSYSQFTDRNILQWELTEWTLTPIILEGNPFDIKAEVTFFHDSTGISRVTPMFFDGDSSFIFRFTGTNIGEWRFITASDHKELDKRKGKIIVSHNSDSTVHGFIKQFGSRWGWQGAEEAFIPQYVMGKSPDYYYDFEHGKVDVDKIDKDVQEFVIEHGFTGFHIGVGKQWFDIEGNGPFENPDPRTYQVLEVILTKVHSLGGACHIWMWGSDGPRDRKDGDGPRGIIELPGNEKDRRNLRYLSARIGPIPGWSMGYGIDTENGVATVEQLNEWKSYLEAQMGWDHFIGARVGYDEKGLWALSPPGPRPAHDEYFCSEIKDEHCFWLGGDYVGYTSYRPQYDRYRVAIQHQPQKPSFEEDRFRLRNSPKWTYKDYSTTLTRRGLWNSAMAGGIANIWGNLLPESNNGGSQSYNVDTIHIKDQIKTYSRFFNNRFSKDLEVIEIVHSPELRCLLSADHHKIILYQEDTDQISFIGLNISKTLPMIAIDTKLSYREISIQANDEGVWEAPYTSDWAVAIGDFK